MTMLNKTFILLLTSILFIIPNSSNAQGFTFDKESYAERAVVENNRGALPSKHSLKKYTPIIYPQETGNCVAQSFANALSISVAKELGLYDKTEITLFRPSPFFLYYSLKSNTDYQCDNGLDAEKAALFLLNNGTMLMMGVEYPNYYPFTEKVLCNQYPPSYYDDKKTALNYKPTDIFKIESLLDIKIALANDMPIVIGMMVPPSFTSCRNYVWNPSVLDKIENSYGHAMTIVGYDDNRYGGSFEIMNSWGEDWGVNGYTHIRYRDAAKWIVAGWAIDWRKSDTRYKYDGGFNEKESENLAPSEEMIKIFSEARQDTLIVNPFFQRTDLQEMFLKLNE